MITRKMKMSLHSLIPDRWKQMENLPGIWCTDVSLVTISHDPGFNILEMLINRDKTNALAIYNRFQVTKMIIYIFLKDLPILYHWNDCAKNDDLLFITV